MELDSKFKDDVWSGLKRNPYSGNWFWRRSGDQFEHQGVNISKAWREGQPNGARENESCAYFDLGSQTNDLRTTLYDTYCSSTYVEYFICEIPYV